MKPGIPGILVVGCLLVLLMAGCKSPQDTTPPPETTAATNGLAVTNNANHWPRTLEKQQSFKKYDESMVSIIKQKWSEKLNKLTVNTNEQGSVIVSFQLQEDGSVSDVHVIKSTVGTEMDSICLDAIKDNAPYQPWPEDMLRTIGRPSFKLTVKFDIIDIDPAKTFDPKRKQH
jgi:TonB family protein